MRINREKIADKITGGTLSALRSEVSALDQTVLHVKESLHELEAERRADRAGWQDVQGGSGADKNDFTPQFVRTIARDGRLKYLKNPVIRRGVNVSALYTFAQGVTVHCEEANANTIWQAFWDEKTNRRAFTSTISLFTKEVERKTSGNIFLAIFTAPDGSSRVRSVPADQITEIITDPEDACQVWFYKREWSQKVFDKQTGLTRTEDKVAYYPSLDYEKQAGDPDRIGNGLVEWTAPVYHIKSGTLSDMLQGLAETYPAHDWATSYNEFLEDRASVAASLSVFSWVHKAKSGMQRALQSVGAAANGINRAVRTAAGQIAGIQGGGELEAIKTQGATINPDEGRRYLLMACAALGIPETFLGDVSVGTLATAESLDWPTALGFVLVQAFWTEVFTDIATHVLKKAGYQDTAKAGIKVDWPDIIKANIKDRLEAVKLAKELLPGEEGARVCARHALNALGEAKVDEILKKLDLTSVAPITQPAAPPVGGAQ